MSNRNVKPGERVIAILSKVGKVVNMMGAGVFEGSFESPMLGLNNPRIKLDNGNTIWGFQCWWGPEKYINESLLKEDGLIIKQVDVEEFLRKYEYPK